jgi:hypothetical protein
MATGQVQVEQESRARIPRLEAEIATLREQVQMARQREADVASELRLVNGGRVLALPHMADTILGYSSVDVLVMDEAARIHDQVFRAVRPMLAVSKGKMIALSTPHGQRGWFWNEWHDCELQERMGRPEDWRRVKVPWTACPRITPEYIEGERRKPSVGPQGIEEEFNCVFLPAAANCPIDVEAMQALLDDVRGGW